MTNPAFNLFKQKAEQLYNEHGVKYSAKDPKVAAWMLDTLVEATEKGDEHLRDLCASGLMLRYWSVFTTKKVGVEVDYDTKISYGWKGIELALEYKAWQNPEKNVNADQAVTQCIHTTFLRENYLLNLDKSKANNFSTSMDEEVGELFGGEGKATLGDTLVDEADVADRENFEATAAATSLVQSYINKNKIVEAIILDTIAFNDVNKETKKVVKYVDLEGNPKKYTQTYKEFWPFRCVQILSQLPDTYASYFGKKYQFNPAEFDQALAAIRGATNQKLYKYLDRTLADARGVVTR
jgi:hypothetical protein